MFVIFSSRRKNVSRIWKLTAASLLELHYIKQKAPQIVLHSRRSVGINIHCVMLDEMIQQKEGKVQILPYMKGIFGAKMCVLL